MPVDDDRLATAAAFEAALFVPSRVSGLGAGLIGRSAGIAEQQLDQAIRRRSSAWAIAAQTTATSCCYGRGRALTKSH